MFLRLFEDVSVCRYPLPVVTPGGKQVPITTIDLLSTYLSTLSFTMKSNIQNLVSLSHSINTYITCPACPYCNVLTNISRVFWSQIPYLGATRWGENTVFETKNSFVSVVQQTGVSVGENTQEQITPINKKRVSTFFLTGSGVVVCHRRRSS